MQVTLYTTHCPKCRALEIALKKHNIPFNIVEDEELMISMGFAEAPKLDVDGEIMGFAQAINWVNQKGI